MNFPGVPDCPTLTLIMCRYFRGIEITAFSYSQLVEELMKEDIEYTEQQVTTTNCMYIHPVTLPC